MSKQRDGLEHVRRIAVWNGAVIIAASPVMAFLGLLSEGASWPVKMLGSALVLILGTAMGVWAVRWGRS